MRILGVTIPEKKRIEIGLTEVFGIGRVRAHEILTEAKIDFGKKPADISVDDENKIRKIMDKMASEGDKFEGDLKREVAGNVKRLKDIQCYRGTRHYKRLPSRGQRTKVNSRTVRGNVRKTMGSGRRTVEKK